MRRALRCTSTDARLLAAMRSGVGVACARMTTGIRSAITRTLRARGRFVTRNGADGIRTHDPLVANQVLSQLSYRPRTENRAGAPARVAELPQQSNLTGRRDAEVVYQEQQVGPWWRRRPTCGNVDRQPAHRLAETQRRSEERRVGKECRSRWSPYH